MLNSVTLMDGNNQIRFDQCPDGKVRIMVPTIDGAFFNMFCTPDELFRIWICMDDKNVPTMNEMTDEDIAYYRKHGVHKARKETTYVPRHSISDQ